jgi:Na+-transporting NADH:ubiquinone oxidoreductase subunit B
MNKIGRYLDKIAPKFEKGGPLERWYPLFEAADTIFYASRRVTKTAPHVRDAVDMKRIMTTVVISLIPCMFMAMWNTGLQANTALHAMGIAEPAGWRGFIMSLAGCNPDSFFSNFLHGSLYFLPVYLISLIAGAGCELAFNIIRKQEVSEAFLVTSLLYPLTLPPTIPLWQAATGIMFGITFGKQVFGGVGRNFMNPALVSRAFVFFAYPAQMSGDAIWTAVDGFTKATPLASLAHAMPGQAMNTLDISWSQAFLGTMPGSMGETSVLACLMGAFLLLITGIGSWRIMFSMLLGGLGTALMFWLIGSPNNPMFSVPPHWHLVIGGFAFGLVFMATDPVSSANTHPGQWIYGLFIGMMAIVIRVLNPAFSEGVMLSILLGNILAPLIDYFVIQANIKRRRLRHG